MGVVTANLERKLSCEIERESLSPMVKPVILVKPLGQLHQCKSLIIKTKKMSVHRSRSSMSYNIGHLHANCSFKLDEGNEYFVQSCLIDSILQKCSITE